MNDAVLLTFYDLKRLIKRLSTPLKYIGLILFCLTLGYYLCKRPQYLARATFKHVNKQADISGISKELFKDLAWSTPQSPIFSVMHSNQVLKGVIDKLAMQICVQEELSLKKMARRALDNISNEFSKTAQAPDSFLFRHASFEGEKKLKFYLQPLDATSYQILSAKKEVIAVGKLGSPLLLPQCHFTLLSFPKAVEMEKVYSLHVHPWVCMVEKVKRQFEVRTHKIEKNVFYLYFKHPDRLLAAEFLNSVMQSYQEYYQRENEEICQLQVAYLEKRQKELIKEFDSALTEHVHHLENMITEDGCVGFSNQLNALIDPQNAFNDKLFDVDLELKRLESIYANRSNDFHELNLKERLDKAVLQCELEEKRLSEHSLSSSDEKMMPIDDVLTLESAKTLYVQYSEKKDGYEAQLKERIFLRDQLNTPNFELSSLSTFLTDPVSLSLAQNASALALKLRDGENRTTREQERLKEELDMQKRFLYQHLSHMIELGELQINLLTHKISALQLQTHHLLEAEKHLLREKIQEFKTKMVSLPEKWHQEQLLSLKKEMSARILGAMTQLVETKKLNEKLYHATSRQLDYSYPPLRPLPPRLFLHAILVSFTICFVYYLCALCRLLCIGLPVSPANLKQAGYFACGMLTSKCHLSLQTVEKNDKETIRTLSQFIESDTTPCCVALIHGKNPNPAHALSELLFLSGKKVLTLYSEKGFDLKTLVNKEVAKIPIQQGPTHDELAFTPLDNPQLLHHPTFTTLMHELKSEYDVILLCSNKEPKSNASHLFMPYVDKMIILTQDESHEDLEPYRTWAKAKNGARLAFACFD